MKPDITIRTENKRYNVARFEKVVGVNDTVDMHQITFSDQSLVEFNKLDKISQLQFIDQLSAHCDECLRKELVNIKKFRRGEIDIYRCRINDLRVYFELCDDIVMCTYILHQHSLSDFIYRSNLPISDEQMFEQYDSFWKYLESLKKDTK